MGIRITVLGVSFILVTCYIPLQDSSYLTCSHGEPLMTHPFFNNSQIPLGDNNEPTIKDNAAHFIYYQDDPYILHWREWWYLNVETTTNDRLVIMFLTAGDLNKPYLSITAVIMVFMREDGSTFWTATPYSSSRYTPDYERCNVKIGDNYFRACGNDTYQIQYHNPFHSLILDLTLTKSRQGIKHGNCVTSLGDWEFMGWCIPVSFGSIQGKLCYKDSGDNHEYTLNGHGYHDHNWGLIRWNKLSWDWGAFSSPQFPFSIIYGQTYYDNTINGNINIVNETLKYSISAPELKIDHLEWTKIGWYIRPSKIWLHGQSSNCSINLTVHLKLPYIIGFKNMGRPYLLGAMQGNITLPNTTYAVSDILGFYEFHTLRTPSPK